MEKLFDKRLLARIVAGGVDADLTTSLGPFLGRRKKDGKRIMDFEGLSATGEGGGRGGESAAARLEGRGSVERGEERSSSEVESLGR